MSHSVRKLIEDAGGTVTSESGPLPDGSGFMTASFPLPKSHWLYKGKGRRPPPALPNSAAWRNRVRTAARYAIRDATRSGKLTDFDPDALSQQLVLALCGPGSHLVAK